MSTRVAVTGMGVVCSVGSSVSELTEALRAGRSGVEAMAGSDFQGTHVRLAARLRDFSWRQLFEKKRCGSEGLFARALKVLQNTTDSTRWSACAALQAMSQSGLLSDPAAIEEMGLIVGGNNLSQSYVAENILKFNQPDARFNPKYAVSFFDSNQLGCLSEIFGLRGPGLTVGAASAAGNAAIFQAWQWIRSGLTSRCLAVGAGSDFSPLELEAFAVLGAACAGPFESEPARACRPFDTRHAGFVWGQAAGALVLEDATLAVRRGATIVGEIAGASLLLEGRHSPDPDTEGEVRAMRQALASGGTDPAEVDYLNAHGTSSPLGDRVECAAIKQVFPGPSRRLRINSTKCLTGHCLGASGVIEAIATLLQMEQSFLHPNINLETPIDSDLGFVGRQAEFSRARCAVSNGFGFGGISSSVVMRFGGTFNSEAGAGGLDSRAPSSSIENIHDSRD